jgi:hypothetical protein
MERPATVDALLTMRRRFMLWYDAQPKDRSGGDGSNQCRRATAHKIVRGSSDGITLAAVYGLDPDDAGARAVPAAISSKSTSSSCQNHLISV